MKTVAIKERPILFSGPMIRAILDGKKTQTRRVVKSKAKNMQAGGQVCVKRNPDGDHWYKEYVWSVRDAGGVWNDYTEAQMLARCPYGKPGDRLWARETWQHEDGSCSDHKCGQPTHIYHKATESFPESMRWKPSIFMPRWACRLELEITGVRVERVKDISHEDAVAEGCYRIEPCEAYPHGNSWGRSGYAALWESINGPGVYGWTANPYVWVVEFERLSL